jgi:adenine-specific DNA-methyltransferase
VDAPVTLADIKSIAAEVWRSVGKGKESATKAAVDVLGWDFALEVNEVAKQIAAESKIDVSFKIIPREVLEKKAVEQGDIRFFELASLSVDVKSNGMEASAKLKDFVIPPQDVPEEVQKAITHWSQWIDYWAIDWDYKNDTFHNQWQSFRTRKDPKIALEATHTYETPSEYQVVVKVIDILGNDTTKLVKVQVAGAQSKKQKAQAASRG